MGHSLPLLSSLEHLHRRRVLAFPRANGNIFLDVVSARTGLAEVTTPGLAPRNTGHPKHAFCVCACHRPRADDGVASIFGSPRGPEELRLRQPGGFPEVSLRADCVAQRKLERKEASFLALTTVLMFNGFPRLLLQAAASMRVFVGNQVSCPLHPPGS